MRKFLYPRLAAQNIRKNRQFYLPYLLTILGAVAAFYIMSALVFDPGAENLPGYVYVRVMMTVGMVIAGAFCTIFLFYTNSFLMKRRQKELGLYNILGMGKRHIGIILCFESLYIGILGIGGGLILGILFHKLVSLLLFNMLNLPIPFGFSLSVQGLTLTACLFAVLIFLTLLSNLFRIRLSNPIELLRGSNVGERGPKTRWLLTLIGILALGAGYYIATVTDNGVDAIAMYFVAVGLVIIGTYCLFTAVSIFVLKLLRRNKKFYYKTSHFIGISGMLYRMKQNAVGLANICILSTMVVVMVSGTLSLSLGTEDLIHQQCPADLVFDVNLGAEEDREAEGASPFNTDALAGNIADFLDREGAQVTAMRCGTHLTFTVGLTDGGSFTTNPASEAEPYTLTILTAADYAAFTGETVTLGDGEAILYTSDKALSSLATFRLTPELSVYVDAETVTAPQPADLIYAIAGHREDVPALSSNAMLTGDNNLCLVVPGQSDFDAFNSAQTYAYGDFYSVARWSVLVDLDATNDEIARISEDFWSEDPDVIYANTGYWYSLGLTDISTVSQEAYGLAGGFLFLGIFLGLLFLMATVLIIYYKQITEGYEDAQRFAIMQQVGLSQREVKKSIRSQILMVFFLPIAVAAVHIIFDFNMVIQLLSLFSLYNVGLTALCTLGTVLVFFLVYGAVYSLTARTYYKIVK